MSTTVLWILLALFVVGCIGAAIVVGRRLWRLFVTARRVQEEVLPLVDEIARGADVAARKAAELGDRGVVLSERIAVLQGSVARLMVLVRAVQEAGGQLTRLRRSIS